MQILTSMWSVVGEDSVTLNHGGELKVQHELVGPHPCPSHRGSLSGKKTPWSLSPVHWVLPVSQKYIVLTHKWRNTTSTSAPSNTGACWNRDSPLFIKTISKCPDMFAGGAMCDTNSINIETVDWPTIARDKGLWISYGVANDPPTHLVILLTTSGVAETLTATSGGPSPTHPEWGGVLPPHRGAVLGRVGHVKVS